MLIHALLTLGCLRPTPADNLPILAGIQPAELRRRGATLGLRAMEPGHLLHSVLTHSSGAAARRLKSRHPFVPAEQQLISFSDNNNIRAGSGRIINGTRSGRTTRKDSAFSFPTPAPTPRNDPPKKSLGQAEPPPHRCRTFPLLFVQRGYGL